MTPRSSRKRKPIAPSIKNRKPCISMRSPQVVVPPQIFVAPVLRSYELCDILAAHILPLEKETETETLSHESASAVAHPIFPHNDRINPHSTPFHRSPKSHLSLSSSPPPKKPNHAPPLHHPPPNPPPAHHPLPTPTPHPRPSRCPPNRRPHLPAPPRRLQPPPLRPPPHEPQEPARLHQARDLVRVRPRRVPATRRLRAAAADG